MVWARRACACVGVRERWCELELGQIESLVIKAIKRGGNAKIKERGIIKSMDQGGERSLGHAHRDQHSLESPAWCRGCAAVFVYLVVRICEYYCNKSYSELYIQVTACQQEKLLRLSCTA